ncbi:uncharacterized protein FYW61_020676 isoform 1-T2 [Anableps anableps]
MFLQSVFSSKPPTVQILTDSETKPLTNDQICDFIAAQVAQFRSSRERALLTKTTSKQPVSLLQPESSTSPPTLVVSPPQAFTSDNHNEHKQSSNATAFQLGTIIAGRSPEEDSLRTAKSSSESEKKEDSRILSEVISTCEKDEQSPVVTTTICAASCDRLDSFISLSVVGSSSEKDNTFLLDRNKTLDDKNGKSEVCQQQKMDSVKEGSVAVTLRSSTAKDKSRKAGKTQTDRACSPGSHQQNLTKKFKQTKPNHLAQSKVDGTPTFSILIDPQYDNISDVEEPSGILTSEQYEDISEDENQFCRKQAGRMDSTPPVVFEACSKTLENVEIYGSTKTPTLDEMTDIHSPCSVEAADESEHLLCGERVLLGQTNYFYEEVNDHSDEEESEDEWEVIPIIISDFKFELVEKEAASGKVVKVDGDDENQIHQCGISCTPKPVPASAFSKMPVFDTPDDQEQAIRFGQLSFVALPCGSPMSKSPRKELCSEHEDSCDTDDSSSYSSGPECNYMTVPKELFKSPAQRKADRCMPENWEDVQINPLLERVQTRVDPGDCIINLLDSDEEDDNYCETEAKKVSQTSENWDDPCSIQQRGSPKSMDSESEECVIAEDLSKQNNESVVIILSDSDDEGRENYNLAKKTSTAASIVCCRGGSSSQERNITPEVARSDKNQKSSRPRVSSQQSDNAPIEALTREVSSSEAEDSDDVPNEGVNVLVPKRKKQRTASSPPRLSSEAYSTGSSHVIPRMIVRESKSDEPATLVREPRDPRQDPRKSLPVTKSLPTKKLQLLMRERPDKPVSIPKPTADAHRNSSRHIIHASPSHSSDNPSALAHRFTPGRFPPSSATSHARNKVFSDWKNKHVPLRKEKKYKRAKVLRRLR